MGVKPIRHAWQARMQSLTSIPRFVDKIVMDFSVPPNRYTMMYLWGRVEIIQNIDLHLHIQEVDNLVVSGVFSP
jgi:hypothetical protein